MRSHHWPCSLAFGFDPADHSHLREVCTGAALAFLGVAVMFSINAISAELEDPFDDTPNDLALEYHVANFTDFNFQTVGSNSGQRVLREFIVTTKLC